MESQDRALDLRSSLPSRPKPVGYWPQPARHRWTALLLCRHHAAHWRGSESMTVSWAGQVGFWGELLMVMPLRCRGCRCSFVSHRFHWYFHWYQLQLVLGSQHSHRLPEGLEQLYVISPRFNYPLYNRDENNTCLLWPPCLYVHWPSL